MIKQPASIFNDVIGPIMRGPSSSHTAAAVRIGRLVRQTIKGSPVEFSADFDPKGSLATTYHGHGSDIGLVGGLMGMDQTDESLTKALEIAHNKGIKISFNVVEYPAVHPNTYRMIVKSDRNEEVHLTAISIGGGMIEIINIENIPVSVSGDFYETLIFIQDADEKVVDSYIASISSYIADLDYCDFSILNGKAMIDIKCGYELPKGIISELNIMKGVKNIIQLSPVLPVLSRKNCLVPFNRAEEMLEIAERENLQIWEMAVLYESIRGNISKEEVFSKMKYIVSLMKDAVEQGFKGTEYKNRILGPQARKLKKSEQDGKLIGGSLINTVIAYITSIMEVKSSMGIIVAAPTAGSCSGLPGTLIGASEVMGLSDDELTKGMLAAGIIGMFIAEHSTFAAEVGGCQAECGSGSGMAAAGLVQLMGGTAPQAVDAASMALQNILGMVCDPVAERVEVPCLGKNVIAGVNAIACANMAAAGYDKVIPFDETLDAMDKVGRMLPPELRCTGHGGLSKTITAQNISKMLD